MYSTVKENTNEVSRPNQTRLGVEWNGGNVSSMVIMAERTIRKVIKTCTANAAVEDVGSSKRSYNARFDLAKKNWHQHSSRDSKE